MRMNEIVSLLSEVLLRENNSWEEALSVNNPLLL